MKPSTRDFPVLTTERLVLAIGDEGDADAMADYLVRNRAFHAPTSPRSPEELYTAGFWAKRFAAQREEFVRAQAVRLLLRPREAPRGEVLGHASFSNIVWGVFHACNLGYSLDERAQGRGLMYEALRAALAYAFDELALHRVMANYLPTNERSGRLLRRLGFAPEGYARDYLFIDGAWRDHVLTSLTSPRPVTPG